MVYKIKEPILQYKKELAAVFAASLFIIVSYFKPQIFLIVIITIIVLKLDLRPLEKKTPDKVFESKSDSDFDPELRNEGIKKRMQNLKQYQD
jgi:hypothetical protein